MNDRSRPGEGGSENQAAAKQLDASILPRAADNAALQAMPDPFCVRCGGPSGPEGAWCDNCIPICREYTLWLDLQRDKRVGA
jgi:hypothetical protein